MLQLEPPPGLGLELPKQCFPGCEQVTRPQHSFFGGGFVFPAIKTHNPKYYESSWCLITI